MSCHSFSLIREWEVNGECEAPHECVVQVVSQVGRQDGQPVVLLHPLEEIRDFHIRVAIVGIAHFRTLAEDGIRLVEEEQHRRPLEDRPHPRLAPRLGQGRAHDVLHETIGGEAAKRADWTSLGVTALVVTESGILKREDVERMMPSSLAKLPLMK